MTDKQKALKKYLRMDYWKLMDIPYLLSGTDPQVKVKVKTYTGGTYYNPDDYLVRLGDGAKIVVKENHAELKALCENSNEISEIFSNSIHPPEEQKCTTVYGHTGVWYKSKYCIVWAKEKGIEIPWLEWAIENGFVVSDSTEQENFRKFSTLYPPLIATAITVYREAWEGLPKGMKQPTKEELASLLKKRGVTVPTEINAIIKVSTPNGKRLGGRQNSELENWRPAYERK